LGHSLAVFGTFSFVLLLIMDVFIADLFIALRCLVSTVFVFGLMFALLPFPEGKKKSIFFWSSLAGLVGGVVIVLLYHYANGVYTLVELLYFPLILIGVLTILFVYFRKNIWYSLFAFSLAMTAYLVMNFPTEILRRYLSDPFVGNSLYLVLRVILFVLLFLLFDRVLRKRLLAAEEKIGKQFVYPFLLSASLMILLAFVGIFPTMWYRRDNSVFYLIGYTALFIPAVYVLIYHFMKVLLEQSEKNSEEKAMSLKIAGLEERLKQEESHEEEMAKLRHDLHHHIDALSGLLSQGKNEEAMAYLKAYRQESVSTPPSFHSGSFALDAILSLYQKEARASHIAFEAVVLLPEIFPFNETETIAFFANLLENALAGAKRSGVPSSIKLVCSIGKGFFRLREENSSVPVLFKDGLPLRENGMLGIGAERIQSLLERHDGFSSFTYQNGLFVVEAALPLRN
jgi:two-component system sensor histidine kinase AgrC